MADSSFGLCYRRIGHGEIQTLSLSAYTICTHACMNPRRWLEVWCNIHMHRQPNPHSVWGFLVRNHGATSKVFHCYSKTHLSIHMFGPHACSGCLRGLANCVIIGEIVHLLGRMDGHHFDQQQERGCTIKVDYSWSVLCFSWGRDASLARRLKVWLWGGGWRLLLRTLLGEPRLGGACIHSL